MTQSSVKPKAPKGRVRRTSPPADLNRRREWRFDLPLPATVEGWLPQGRKFKTMATIRNISATGALLRLDKGIDVGTKLKLSIEIPKRATEGEKVRLQIGGITIRLEKPDRKGKKQGVAVRFSKDFKFVGAKT